MAAPHAGTQVSEEQGTPKGSAERKLRTLIRLLLAGPRRKAEVAHALGDARCRDVYRLSRRSGILLYEDQHTVGLLDPERARAYLARGGEPDGELG